MVLLKMSFRSPWISEIHSMYVGRGWGTDVVGIGQRLTRAIWTSWKMVTRSPEKGLKVRPLESRPQQQLAAGYLFLKAARHLIFILNTKSTSVRQYISPVYTFWDLRVTWLKTLLSALGLSRLLASKCNLGGGLLRPPSSSPCSPQHLKI